MTRTLLLAAVLGCARRELPPRPEPLPLLASHGAATLRDLGAACAEACLAGVDRLTVHRDPERVDCRCRHERSLGVVKVAAPLAVAESGAGSGEGAP